METGLNVLNGMLYNNWNDSEYLRKIEAIKKDINKENSKVLLEERKTQIKKWVGIADEVIDESLIDSYKVTLTDFVAYGPTKGSLMDIAMSVLSELKTSDEMDYAIELCNSLEKETERFYVQSMAFMYSDKGPDFLVKTLGRPLTQEEMSCVDAKRLEISERKFQ